MRAPSAFLLGVREFRSDCTSNPGEDLIEAYDRGRDLAHRLTLRRFDPCHESLEDQALELGLVIDGTAPDGTYQGDAERGPWIIFDSWRQENLGPAWRFRWMARLHLWRVVRRVMGDPARAYARARH